MRDLLFRPSICRASRLALVGLLGLGITGCGKPQPQADNTPGLQAKSDNKVVIALLPKLISGELRVQDPERFIGGATP